jgi:N-acyl-D-amino-acid deacylase
MSSWVVRGGTVFDGCGGQGRLADVLVVDDRIALVGDVPPNVQARVLDATGQSVVPGFINVLSHAWASLQQEPMATSELLQGVTTQVFGEGFSLGPSREGMALELMGEFPQATLDFPRLSEGLQHLERQGVGPNVASLVGGTNLRFLGAGLENRPLTGPELDQLRGLVAEEMQEGALGIGTALIYPPAVWSSTDELVSLCEIVGRYDGLYVSHLRSEAHLFLESLDELIEIGARAGVRAEVYHLKAAGPTNHHKMALAIDRIEQCRTGGQLISANMYPYVAGATAAAAVIPPRFHEGGREALQRRLNDPAIRRQMVAEMAAPSADYENLFLAAGGAGGVLLLGDTPLGIPTSGRRLDDVARELNLPALEVLLELVASDLKLEAAYFVTTEANVELGLASDWVSIGSDSAAYRAESPWSDQPAHPRTYGTFSRVLGHYCRDRKLFSFAEAVRRMTSLPADTFLLKDRGRLVEGAFADLVVLDQHGVRDIATYGDPHRYSEGTRHVLVNGEPVVIAGRTTDARPGRHIRRGR